MKKIIFITAIILLNITQNYGQAPSYTDFELDIISVGYAVPVEGDIFGSGVSFGGDLRYNLKDNFSIGLSNQIVTFNVKELLRNESGDGASSLTIGLVGDYYFSTTSSKRLFAGLGVGFQRFGEYSFDRDGITEEKETILGFYVGPRVGYEFGHLRLMANYNLGLKDELQSYISIGAAITLWGGYNGN